MKKELDINAVNLLNLAGTICQTAATGGAKW